MDLSNGTSPAPEQNLTRVYEGVFIVVRGVSLNWLVKILKFHTIMVMVLLSVVCALGVLGNGVVIWATGFRMKKTVSTVWYLNLAVADFLVTAFLSLQITTKALDDHWPFGWFMCKMDSLIFYLNMCASVFTLAVISVDRCVCVVCPLWARCSGHRTVRKASWVSLGVWVMALAPSIPYAIFSYTEPSSSGEEVWCHVYEYKFNTIGITTNFVVGFVVPFSIIISCYSVIIYRLRNNRSLASQLGRSFKIIGAVIAAFSLCWIPYHSINLILVCIQNGLIESSPTLALVLEFGYPITIPLALVNSCVNPLLYVFSQGFKGVFRRNVLKVLEKAFAETSASLASDQQHSHSPGRQPSNDRPVSNMESKDSPDPETVLSETVV